MKIMIVPMLAAGLLIGCGRQEAAPGAANGGKREKIVALLEATGSLDMGKQMSTAMLNQIFSIWQQGGTKIDPAVIEKFKRRFSEEVEKDWTVSGSFVGKLVDVYAKFYTEAEIDDLSAFYRTETGKKMIKTMPAMMAESMAIGQKWGEERGLAIAKEITAEIKQAGHDIPNI